MRDLQVLAAASEMYPLVKTGGLADVVAALPGALRAHGIAVRTLVPGYPAVMEELEGKEKLHKAQDLFGAPAALIAGTVKDHDIIALDAPHLYHRSGNPYVAPGGSDWPDNAQRFAALGLMAAEIGRGAIAGYRPDIVHAHDWQAALAPVYLRYGPDPKPKTVITIHNLAFQGQFPSSVFGLLHLPAHAFAIDGVEYYRNIGFLKGGLTSADAITAVSPSYAEEICTPEGGMGLDGLLRARRSALTGIVNGIDSQIWNPATDSALAAQYNPRSLQHRTINKRLIEKRFALEPGDGPLYAVVSRLTWQKGMDILAATADVLVASGARLALLGSGDAAIEQDFAAAALRHKGRIGVITGYDEPVSHLLQGGADAILIPSRYEPCGLTQLYALRYGCVPVVSRVGGLADTIIDANEAALVGNAATGIQFAPVEGMALENALMRSARLYRDQKTWRAMQQRGMKVEVSWARSASRYASLYRSLVEQDKS